MFYVYILKLSNGKYYIGYSSKLKNRVDDHINGNVRQTRNFIPLRLIYYSAFKNKLKALQFEHYLKTPSGFAFRNKRFI
ncbi:MAG: GIY-YIG nuclease family protein [Nanoarchaeota archaeon]